MRRIHHSAVVLTAAAFLLPSTLHAGMTVYVLNDVYRLRLEDISFFLLLLVLCALVLRVLWNHGFRGFPQIPRLGFVRALCLSVLFGLVMLLILTMISGIREVLTPGAWRRQGSAYKLNDPAMESTRQRSLQHLRTALFDYARLHEGRFPPHDFIAEIPAKLWEAPDREGTRYVYQSGLTILQTNALLASEPPVFGERRYALLAGGALQLLVDADIRRLANIPPP